MPVTHTGDGMPRDKGTGRLPKPPSGVPTFAARGPVGPRFMVLALVAVLGAATVSGIFEGPPAGSSTVTTSPPSPDSALTTPRASEPPDEGPAGAPLPASSADPAPPPKHVRPTSAPPEELTGYQWPLRGARITSRFGARSFGGFVLVDGEEVHDGLDLARFCGFKVRAAHDGVVLYAGRKFDEYIGYKGSAEGIYSRLQRQGRIRTLPIVVVVDDGNGYRSVYVHLSKAEVQAGDVVKAGDVIGREGATGFATGCHLHYTLIRMDGPWQEVVPGLHQYGYPTLVRQRVDPLVVLAWDDIHAPERLRQRVGAPSPGTDPSPGFSPTPSASPAVGPSPSVRPSPPVGPSPSASPASVSP